MELVVFFLYWWMALALALLGWTVIRSLLFSLCPFLSPSPPSSPPSTSASSSTTTGARLLVILGSGGHTAEMVATLGQLDRTACGPNGFHIQYVLAASDTTSLAYVTRFENKYPPEQRQLHFAVIPRSREVGQSYLTSIFSSLYSLGAALQVVLHYRPTVVLCNGPGTCIPVAYSALLLQVPGLIPYCSVLFIESFCRVLHLSLTGRLLYPVASKTLVQWPELVAKYPGCEFHGSIH